MYLKLFKKTLCAAGAVAAIVALTGCSFGNSVKLKDSNRTFENAAFTKIDAYIDWGKFTLSSSDDENVYVVAKDVPDTFKTEIVNGVLVVDFNPKSNTSKPRKANTNVIVKVPAKDYADFNLDFGAGDSFIENLTCSKITINCGAGKLEAKNITTDSKVKVDGGTGSIKILESTIGGLDANLGVGEFLFTGTINGNISLDCGIGNATLNLENPESDFVGSNKKYSLNNNSGIGKITITYKN